MQVVIWTNLSQIKSPALSPPTKSSLWASSLVWAVQNYLLMSIIADAHLEFCLPRDTPMKLSTKVTFQELFANFRSLDVLCSSTLKAGNFISCWVWIKIVLISPSIWKESLSEKLSKLEIHKELGRIILGQLLLALATKNSFFFPGIPAYMCYIWQRVSERAG